MLLKLRDNDKESDDEEDSWRQEMTDLLENNSDEWDSDQDDDTIVSPQ